MNTKPLETLPNVENKFNLPLIDGERVLFAAKTEAFCTETQYNLGWNCEFTMTDRRIVVDGGTELWKIDILNDVVRCKKIEEGRALMKLVYIALDLNKKTVCCDGKITLNGYVVYFKKKDMIKFEEIAKKLFD